MKNQLNIEKINKWTYYYNSGRVKHSQGMRSKYWSSWSEVKLSFKKIQMNAFSVLPFCCWLHIKVECVYFILFSQWISGPWCVFQAIIDYAEEDKLSEHSFEKFSGLILPAASWLSVETRNSCPLYELLTLTNCYYKGFLRPFELYRKPHFTLKIMYVQLCYRTIQFKKSSWYILRWTLKTRKFDLTRITK